MVVFVAGDGASGRIMVEAEDRLRGKMRTRVLVQRGGGAEGLCKGEFRPHLALAEDCRVAILADLMREAALLVVAHSGKAFQLECLANRIAFEQRLPNLRVIDHPLGTYHAYFRELVKDWQAIGRPPFSVTAITPRHAEEIVGLLPELADRTQVIGNPLHIKLETLFAEGRSAVRVRLRARYGLPADRPVAALFLSGNNDEQFSEMFAMADIAMKVLADLGMSAIVDVHFVNKEWKPKVDEWFKTWRLAQATIVADVPHDEMIAMSDVLVVSPTSTSVERGLAYGIPVIQCAGPNSCAEIERKTGRTFPNYTPELEHKLVLWVDQRTVVDDWYGLIAAALDPDCQAVRSKATQACGIVPESGAMARLLELIRSQATGLEK